MLPFDLSTFSRMGMSLQRILELKFRLKYFLNVSFSDFNDTDLSELVWMESRLRRLEEEKEAYRKGNK